MKASERVILVYDDAGADAFCVECLVRQCRQVHGSVERIDARGLLAGGWEARCVLLAFPGGADRPYAERLNGRGNALIRRYVEAGGRFLGVCAGAYYACRRIDFTGGDFSVKAERELGFFPGTAVGSLGELAAPYRVQDLRCAAAVEVSGDASPGGGTVLYWGGCRFEIDPGEAENVTVLLRYAALPPGQNLAAVGVRRGRGKVVLTGVHAEVRGIDFDRHRHAYPQGQAPDPGAQAHRLMADEPARARLFAGLLAHLDLEK